MTRLLSPLLWTVCLLLVACSTGPVRRISEPTASIQQLSVAADGSWSLDLRLQNYSSIAMRFDRIGLELTVGDEAVGMLQATPQLSVAPESADVFTLALTPPPAVRILLADTLADGRSVRYSLQGELNAVPTDRGRARDYRVERDGVLSPVPGLPGVLR